MEEIRYSILENPDIAKEIEDSHVINEKIIVLKPNKDNFCNKISIIDYPFSIESEESDATFLVEISNINFKGETFSTFKVLEYYDLIQTIRSKLNYFKTKTPLSFINRAFAEFKSPEGIYVSKTYYQNERKYNLCYSCNSVHKQIDILADTDYINFSFTIEGKEFHYHIDETNSFKNYLKLIKYIEAKIFCF